MSVEPLGGSGVGRLEAEAAKLEDQGPMTMPSTMGARGAARAGAAEGDQAQEPRVAAGAEVTLTCILRNRPAGRLRGRRP